MFFFIDFHCVYNSTTYVLHRKHYSISLCCPHYNTKCTERFVWRCLTANKLTHAYNGMSTLYTNDIAGRLPTHTHKGILHSTKIIFHTHNIHSYSQYNSRQFITWNTQIAVQSTVKIASFFFYLARSHVVLVICKQAHNRKSHSKRVLFIYLH